MSRTPPVRRPCGDGHPPHPPRRPVADCQGTQSVARCRGPRCRHTPCREPTRPLASWPFSQLCRLACQVAIIAYDRRRTIEPRGLRRRYEQLETSPETIEQELRPAVCERRQTDRLNENYSIDDRFGTLQKDYCIMLEETTKELQRSGELSRCSRLEL